MSEANSQFLNFSIDLDDEQIQRDIKTLIQKMSDETGGKFAANRVQTRTTDDCSSGLWCIVEDEYGEPVLVPAEHTDLLEGFKGFPENQQTQSIAEYLLKKPMVQATVKPEKTVWDLELSELNRKGRRIRGIF